MPYSRRSGRRYAAGSHTTLGGWEPKRCAYGERCLHGGKIVISGPHALWFHFDDIRHVGYSLHVDCWKQLGPWRGYPEAPVPSPARETG